MSAQLIVESEDAKQALVSSMNELKDAFQEQNLEVAEIEVSVAPRSFEQQEQSSKDQPTDSKKSGKSGIRNLRLDDLFDDEVEELMEEEKIAVYHSKLLQTEWMPKESFTVQLKGLNFDDVWENIILQIGDFELQGENTLEEQIAVNEQQEKLKKEIERLEKLARKETQPKKKFEIVQKIKKLKEELIDG